MSEDCKNGKCFDSDECASLLECEASESSTPVSRFSDGGTFSPRVIRKG